MMMETFFKTLGNLLAVLSLGFTIGFVSAQEKVIQEEKMSFEKCLQVIDASADKLSISPNVENSSPNNRIATFILSDGILSIICDGIEGTVKVSTKMN